MHALNSLSYRGDPRRKPRIIFDTQEPEDISQYADSLPKLVDIGFRIPASWAQDKLRIPEPEGEEAILARAAATPAVKEPKEKDADKDEPKQEPQTAALRLALAALKAQQPKDDGADVLTKRLAQQAGESFSQLMQPIETLVANVDSLEALLEQLLELEDQLPIEDYQLLLGQAFTAAELSGRFDVNEGR